MNVMWVPRAVAGTATALLLIGCGGQKSAKPKATAITVETAVAKRGAIETTAELDGQIAPLRSAQLAFVQSGAIVALYAKEGDRVREGETLGKIDDSSLVAQAAQLRAQIREADARARSAAYAVPITRAQTLAVVKQAQNTLESDRAALRSAALGERQNAQLLAQGYVSQSAAVSARANLIAAQQRVRIDEQSLASARANTGQTAVSAAGAAADKAAAAAARAQLGTLETSIRQTTLLAPFAGTITQRYMDPGTIASPSAPTFELAQTDVVYLNVNVPQERLGVVKRGTPLDFTVQTLLGKTFRAAFTEVNPVPVSGTLTYRARVAVRNPERLLRGGMPAVVRVVSARSANAVIVPRDAVFTNERGERIFVVENGKAVEYAADPGLETESLAEIKNPKIRPGARVVTVRPDTLQNGGSVKTGKPGAKQPA